MSLSFVDSKVCSTLNEIILWQPHLYALRKKHAPKGLTLATQLELIKAATYFELHPCKLVDDVCQIVLNNGPCDLVVGLCGVLHGLLRQVVKRHNIG